MTLVPAFVAGGVLTAALVHEVGRNSITGLWLLLYGSGLAFMALGTVALGLPASWSPAILALGFGGLHIALGVIIIKDHGG